MIYIYIYKYINFSFNQISSSNKRYKIHSTNEDKYDKSEADLRAKVERSFFNLAFLNFLSIRKDYYKLQQFT